MRRIRLGFFVCILMSPAQSDLGGDFGTSSTWLQINCFNSVGAERGVLSIAEGLVDWNFSDSKLVFCPPLL